MPRFIILLLALMLFTFSGASSAQNYDSFRFVGEVASLSGGAVTSIELSESETSARVSYLNIAGLSTVYDVHLTPSEVIRDAVPVFMPDSDFGAAAGGIDESSLQLDDLQFFTGRLLDPENTEAVLPPHWFRMTLHNGAWSGVFRISDRIYAIDRVQDSPVIDVRSTPSSNTSIQPTTQIKLTALIDENYILNANTPGHVLALESMHVMDGLLSDSLGITFKLEQLIYKRASELTIADNGLDFFAGARNWLNSNAQAHGINDNLATFIFRGGNTESSATTSYGNNNFVLQGNTPHYQFQSSHFFGKLLGLPNESGTLQDLAPDQSIAAAHWSDQQRAYLDNNPMPAQLTQILSYDAPEIAVTEPEQFEPIPDYILESESEEISNTISLQDDDTETALATGGSGGGGMFGLHLLFLLFTTIAYRKSAKLVY